MTEENTPPADAPADAKPEQDPTGKLAEAATKAATADAQKTAELAEEFTPEQWAKVKEHADAAAARAVDGYARKHKEDLQAVISKEGLVSPEQMKAAIAEDRLLHEQKAEAKVNIIKWLSNAGINPDSEDAQKVFDEFNKGYYPAESLTNEKGFTALIINAGLHETQRQPNPSRVSGPVEFVESGKDTKPLTMAQRMKVAADRTKREAGIR